MKKMVAFMFVMAFIIGGSVNSAKAALISLVWDNSVDSAVQSEVDILPGVGTYDISLMVSGIIPEDPDIFELQFDLVAPVGYVFDDTGLTYGIAVENWFLTMGGVVPSQSEIYREASTEWAGFAYPLNNGMLVSGITLTIPDLQPGESFDLNFGNAQGDYADYLVFADMTLTCIPIPGGLILLGSGLIGLIGLGRRRMKRS